MATRPLIATTKIAVGSLIPTIPFQVYNEYTYTGLTAAQVAAIAADPEVNGVHNIASDTLVLGLHDIVLHQIRIRDAVNAGLRPSWAAVTIAETNIAADQATATAKQLIFYTTYSTPVLSLIGTLINGWTNPQQRNVQDFITYMGSIAGLITNGKGRLIGLLPVVRAPIEQHYIITVLDDGWLSVAINNSWLDFIT